MGEGRVLAPAHTFGHASAAPLFPQIRVPVVTDHVQSAWKSNHSCLRLTQCRVPYWENRDWVLHILTHIEFYQVLIIVLPEQRLNASVV